MSRWITFYYEVVNDRVYDLKVHDSKDEALKCFNKRCKNYFQLNTQFKTDKLPASYGYPLRRYYGISANAFKKMFDVTIDEALKIANEELEE